MEKASRPAPAPFKLVTNVVDGLLQGVDGVRRTELTPEQRQQLQRRSRQEIRNLNLEWLNEMVNSRQQLREKMAFFWHGHFASRNLNALYQQDLVNIIRRHALGDFGTLLKEVSRSAAMLAFLNNQQNRKQRPNENFAREVMELFTLGRGHYTEQDVKEAARAFTGWQYQLNGEFVFRQALHDFGEKTVLGRTGPWGGEDVLKFLLEEKQTALFITQKIYRFFVNEQVDPARTKELAEKFYASGYNISSLLRNIFTSAWFYAPQNRGKRIKSPVELLVGIRRTLPMELTNPEVQLFMQRLLGQVLFLPPNVAGWPGGRSWIDSSTLMYRLRVPQLLAGNDLLQVRTKSDDDQEMGRMEQRPAGGAGQRVEATIRWTELYKALEKVPREQLLPRLTGLLWQLPAAAATEQVVGQFTDASGRERYIQSAALRLMATPEYQLC